MMKNVLYFLFLLVSILGFTQNGINYKAVINNDSGQPIVNSAINIQFSILKGTAQTNVYTETHSTNSDDNGIVIVNIGEGSAALGNFKDIDWGNDSHFLKVLIDSGSGYVDMGVTQFKSVPYALSSGDKVWQVNGQDVYRETGNVGIGTTEPVEALHVIGNLFVQSDLGTILFGYPDNGNLWQLTTRNGGGSLLYRPRISNQTSFNTKFVFENTGEFKLGNISQYDAWFHIRNNSTIQKTHILLEEQENDYSRLGFKNTFYTDSEWHIAGRPTSSASSSQINFFYKNASASGDRFIIKGDGRVGINGNPTSRVHIYQGGQSVGTGLAFDDGTANLDWNITHGYSLRFHYGGTLRGYILPTTGAYIQSSDLRLKKNIKNLENVLDKVSYLRPTTYNYLDDSSTKQTIGLIAQEVKQLFPEVVHYSEKDDTYGVDYSAFSIIAIKAIQEQNKLIEKLEQRLKVLENKL